MATAIRIEERAKARIPLAEIAREVRLPYWRVEEICKAAKVAYRT